jgi:predicted transcriptional regulator
VNELGVMHGVVTRRDVLDQVLSDEPSVASIDELLVREPVVAYPDETLRAVSYRMAASSVTRIPVIERGTRRVVGLVSLPQLLQARLRDLREAREAEQVLRFRLVMPTKRTGRRGRVRVD